MLDSVLLCVPGTGHVLAAERLLPVAANKESRQQLEAPCSATSTSVCSTGRGV
jgi:hypothetical protein